MPGLRAGGAVKDKPALHAEAMRLDSPVRQSRDALLGEPIPWTAGRLGPENLKARLLARLPEAPTGVGGRTR